MVLGEFTEDITEYDALAWKLIERITVYDDQFTDEFKSGIEIKGACEKKSVKVKYQGLL